MEADVKPADANTRRRAKARVDHPPQA